MALRQWGGRLPATALAAMRSAAVGAVRAACIQSRPSTSTGSVSPTMATSTTRFTSGSAAYKCVGWTHLPQGMVAVELQP